MKECIELEHSDEYQRGYADGIESFRATFESITQPKTCETYRRYRPWKCTDGSFLDIGDCDYDIRYGRELVDESYQGFVKDDFGCTEYEQKVIE